MRSLSPAHLARLKCKIRDLKKVLAVEEKDGMFAAWSPHPVSEISLGMLQFAPLSKLDSVATRRRRHGAPCVDKVAAAQPPGLLFSHYSFSWSTMATPR